MDKKIAVCVFGVSGVGKFALLEAVLEMHPSTIVAHGTTIVKEALGIASYEALELTPAHIKKQTNIDGIATVIESATSLITIVDTHLVVPIRISGELVVEDMWDEAMFRLFQGFAFITAYPSVVAERRQMNSARPLRVMNAVPQLCAEDLQLNAARWDELSDKMANKVVVINDQSVLIGARRIFRFIQSLL